MNKQHHDELVSKMQEYWANLSYSQKIDIYFEMFNIDLRVECWSNLKCPEYAL